MNVSVVMTVHDREPEVLLGTLRALHRGPLREAQIIVVDDRSSMSYQWIKEYATGRFDRFNWVPTGDYNGLRLAGGYGNPSRAFNVGVMAATEPRLLLLSSDVIVPPRVQYKIPASGLPWTPRVVDMDSDREYCGPTRFFPMPWCLAADRQDVLSIGGWDEAYLDGMCFEDNDFLGRLGIHCGSLLADWSQTVWHQSHHQPAYDATDHDVTRANKINMELTLAKWDGVPFDSERTPFDVRRKPHPSGLQCLTFSFPKDRTEAVMAATRGIKQEVAK